MKNDRKRQLWKVVVLLWMTVAVAVPARSQYSRAYYHRENDTMYLDSPIYHHNWWEFENSLQTHRPVTLGYSYGLSSTGFRWRALDEYMRLGGQRMLSYSFTAQPLRVLGLAVLSPGGYIRDPGPWMVDTIYRQEYLYLYEADTVSLREVASVPWFHGMEGPLRYLYVRGTTRNGEFFGVDYDGTMAHASQGYYPFSYRHGLSFDSTCCSDLPWEFIFYIKEYYFDSVVTVQDSFYVGCSDYSFVDSTDDAAGYADYARSVSPMYMFALDPTATTNCDGQWGDPLTTDVCGVSWPTVFFRYPYSCDNGKPAVRYENHWKIPMIFPIVEVDTTVPPPDYCPAVENLQVFRADDSTGCVVATWDAFVNHTAGYEVQYGRRNQSYSQWQTDYAQQNFFQVCDLDPSIGYGLRVRPYCQEGKRTGEWAEYYFFKPGQLPVGIEEGPGLSRHTSVSPNPTSGQVTVRSDYVLLSLDLYDMQGRHLQNHNTAGSRTYTIGLEGLPAGPYLLQVRTSAGTTTRHILKR
ncbi:MAG: T9SS type A sorting domain-containing protein [Bacteroidales bacterium]|nr:T9SS type A sorting domain-containing protein [Bacteroidales bacterium]